MEIKHVAGRKRGAVILYALSTCVWCRRTKRLLNELGVDYDYVDVDLQDPEDRDKINKKVLQWNQSGSYPTMVINDSQCIVGYDPEKIREVLDNGQ
ncbi:glutaredoxin family protein [candidate division WOR-3 bacterium]|nr:glutaredoxin family protein [candidate division WOR-3 bacterium]